MVIAGLIKYCLEQMHSNSNSNQLLPVSNNASDPVEKPFHTTLPYGYSRIDMLEKIFRVQQSNSLHGRQRPDWIRKFRVLWTKQFISQSTTDLYHAIPLMYNATGEMVSTSEEKMAIVRSHSINQKQDSDSDELLGLAYSKSEHQIKKLTLIYERDRIRHNVMYKYAIQCNSRGPIGYSRDLIEISSDEDL